MTIVQFLKKKLLSGAQINADEALELYSAPLSELCAAADELRKHFCQNNFDLCTIINGKSGKCSENCKFCAQSSHHHGCAAEYPLLPAAELVEQAKHDLAQGVLRYSIVASGKRLSDTEIDKVCEAIRQIREEVGISVCISFGLLNEAQYKTLKSAGVTRVHNNLETSRRNFPNICTTHSFDDKVSAIRAAQSAGLSVCSGGIMGLGETPRDRIDMALTLRELGINSVPINLLNAIPGTPLGATKRLPDEELQRIVAVYRFLLPTAAIRLAGGRGILGDKGAACFSSGANATISGDMLTTAGITVESDLQLIKKLGFEVSLS